MTTEIAGKDSIKLNFLSETLSGSASLSFSLGGSAPSDYRTQIHKDGGQVFIFGNFTVSEESAGNSVKIRPNSVGQALTVDIKFTQTPSDKSAGVFRSSTKNIAESFPVSDDSAKLEFTPNGGSYTVKLVNAGDADREEMLEIQQKTAEVQQKVSELQLQKQQTKEKLKKLEAEYNSDHDALKAELDGLRERTGLDEKILAFYSDKDITPTRELLGQAAAKLEEAEAQIKLFIEAKQQKTIEIETEIKSNKV